MDKAAVACNGIDGSEMEKELVGCNEKDWSAIDKEPVGCNGREIGVRWTNSLLDVM